MRLQQGLRALFSWSRPVDLTPAQTVLSPAEMALFRRLRRSEQLHSLNVLRTVQAAGETDPDLLVAAPRIDSYRGEAPDTFARQDGIFVLQANAAMQAHPVVQRYIGDIREAAFDRDASWKADGERYGSNWGLTDRFKQALATRLKSAMDFKVDSYRGLIEPEAYRPDKIHYEYLHYPDELYPTDNQRELVSFTVVNPARTEGEDARPNAILAFGFTIDFDYINHVFFQNILNEMWQREVAKLQAELTYPIAIEDHLTGEWIATIAEAGGQAMVESKKHLPQTFHNDLFPWYKIHFSDETGEDIMMSARYEKMVYYCLIAAANVIMIAAVISALRNVAHELALSDMRSNFVARVSHELRTFGWQVPAYTMPEGAEDVAVLRVVVREGLSADLARALFDDIMKSVTALDRLKPAGHYDDQQHFSH